MCSRDGSEGYLGSTLISFFLNLRSGNTSSLTLSFLATSSRLTSSLALWGLFSFSI